MGSSMKFSSSIIVIWWTNQRIVNWLVEMAGQFSWGWPWVKTTREKQQKNTDILAAQSNSPQRRFKREVAVRCQDMLPRQGHCTLTISCGVDHTKNDLPKSICSGLQKCNIPRNWLRLRSSNQPSITNLALSKGLWRFTSAWLKPPPKSYWPAIMSQ